MKLLQKSLTPRFLKHIDADFTRRSWITTFKKLSYRRDSARQRSLCRSRSFKVTDFGTNRKPICNFLLVDNTILTSYLAPFLSYRAILIKLSLLTWGASLLRNLCEYRRICSEKLYFRLHFCCRQHSSVFDHFDVTIAQKLPNSLK